MIKVQGNFNCLHFLNKKKEKKSHFINTKLSSYFSVDGDSDSISECRGLSPTITEMSISTTSTASSSMAKLNGCHSMNRNNSHQQIYQRSNGAVGGLSPTIATTSTNGYHHHHNGRSGNSNHSKMMMTSLTESGSSSCSSNSMTKSTNNGDNNKYCDMNGCSKDAGGGGVTSNNGFDIPNGSQGSPLRSQLGLNLKTNKPASNKQSPLQVTNLKTFFFFEILQKNIFPFSFV